MRTVSKNLLKIVIWKIQEMPHEPVAESLRREMNETGRVVDIVYAKCTHALCHMLC